MKSELSIACASGEPTLEELALPDPVKAQAEHVIGSNILVHVSTGWNPDPSGALLMQDATTYSYPATFEPLLAQNELAVSGSLTALEECVPITVPASGESVLRATMEVAAEADELHEKVVALADEMSDARCGNPGMAKATGVTPNLPQDSAALPPVSSPAQVFEPLQADDFLGAARYEPLMESIYAGLGIPSGMWDRAQEVR